MQKIWDFTNGHKTEIAVILTVVLSILARRGVAIDPLVFDVTDSLLGVGLVHRTVKIATNLKQAPVPGADVVGPPLPPSV